MAFDLYIRTSKQTCAIKGAPDRDRADADRLVAAFEASGSPDDVLVFNHNQGQLRLRRADIHDMWIEEGQ
jgi:hypothetical protein